MTGSTSIPLLSGERVLWEGRPAQGLLFTSQDIFLIPFSLFWAGFAVFWNVGVWNQTDIAFTLFGLPFLVLGAYFTVGRFIVDAWLRRRMVYLVTSKRVVILKAFGTSTSLDITRLPALELAERQDGSGTIRFGAAASLFSSGNLGIWQPSTNPTPQFLRIPNVRSVYELIQAQSR